MHSPAISLGLILLTLCWSHSCLQDQTWFSNVHYFPSLVCQWMSWTSLIISHTPVTVSHSLMWSWSRTVWWTVPWEEKTRLLVMALLVNRNKTARGHSRDLELQPGRTKHNLYPMTPPSFHSSLLWHTVNTHLVIYKNCRSFKHCLATYHVFGFTFEYLLNIFPNSYVHHLDR